jgi:hypothetical protein
MGKRRREDDIILLSGRTNHLLNNMQNTNPPDISRHVKGLA